MGRYDKYTQTQSAAPSGGSGRYAKYTTGRDDVISGYAGEILRRNEIYRTIPQEQLADPERLWRLAEKEAERNGYKPLQTKKQDKVSSFVTGYGQGGTFGFADELSGAVDFVGGAGMGVLRGEGLGAIESGKKAYSDRVEKDRRLLRQARVDNPYTTLGGELAGGVITYAPAPAGWMGAGARTTGQVALQTAAKADKLDKIAKTANAARAAKLAAEAAKLRTKAAALSMPAQTIGQAAGRFGGRVGESIVKGAAYGAAYGGVYGFGSGEGDAVERLDDAASGAAFGAAGGAILSPAAQFVLAPIVGRIGYGMFTSADNKALDNFLKRVERSGTSLQQVQDDFARWKKTGEVPETLVEMMGPHERSLLSALISVNRETRERATQIFVGRGREEVNRLEDAFAGSFGAERGDYAKAKAAAERARVEDPEPLYAAAHFDQNGTLKPLDPSKQASLNNILADEDDIGRIVKDAAADLNRMGHKAARDEVRLYGEALQAARRGERVQIPQLSVQAADYIERAINQSYKAVGGGSGEISGSIAGWRKLRNDVRAIIDDTGIGDARATSAERIRRGELLDEGLDIMKPSVDVDDVNRIMQGVPDAGIPAASDEGRKAYGIGAARAVANELRQVPDMGGFADATRKVARTPALRDKLEAARPKVLTKKGVERKGAKQTKANAALDEAIERASNRAQFGVDMVGNSKTAFRQGDVQDAVLDDALSTQIGDSVSDLLMAGVGGASTKLRDRLARGIGNRIGQPSIYRPKLNRAMADIALATGDQIPVQVARLAARAANRKLGRITMRGLPPPPQGGSGGSAPSRPAGGAPVPPASPIRAGGFAGFGGKKPPEPITKDAAIAEVEAIITSRAAAAESVPIIRAATDADYQQALQIANQAINRQYGTRFAKLGHETGPANKGADTYRTSLAEELARVHLREQGLDASAIADRRNRLLGTNAQNEARRSARAKAINEQPEPTADDIALWEIEDAGVDVQGFAERAAKELRLNMPASEMTTTDIVEMAERFARSYMQKGGRNVTEQEALGYEIYVAARGKPTASSGLAAGLRTDLGSGVGGALFAGAMPMEEDATLEDRLARAGTGFLLGMGGSMGGRLGANALARTAGKTRTAGVPKTPQQAAKFETPGSPEWEAAKAKGLDMSQAARMARAKEMGFDTDTVLYHGTDADFAEFSLTGQRVPALGVGHYFSPNPNKASAYGSQILPVYLRTKKLLDWSNLSSNQRLEISNALAEKVPKEVLAGFGKVKEEILPTDPKQARARFDELKKATADNWHDRAKPVMDQNEAGQIVARYTQPGLESAKPTDLLNLAQMYDRELAKRLGYDAAKYGDEIVIFDPSNIRSVNAAFDPDKAASPILTAGFGNIDITAPGQQIAKGLRALDRRVRSPKDPRVIGPMIGELPQRGSNAPAIEQMPRNKAASVLGDAIFIARSAEQAGGQRGALSRGIRNKVKDYSKSLTDRQAASEVVSLPARRARDNWAKAQQDYQDAWARYMALRDSRAPQADLEAAAKEVARLDALRAELKAKIPVQALPPDPKMREIVLRAVRIANRGLNKYRPLNPSRRTLEGYNEVTDLLTNPSRLADARRISQAKPLGTHERAGQVIAGAGAAGAAAYGYNALNEEERRRR